MLVLLPLQFTWAAVACYCGHEIAATPLGHHDHADHSHAVQDADPDRQAGSDGTSPGSSDSDCGHCHGYSAGMFQVHGDFLVQPHASAPPAWATARAVGHVPAQPERPQWVPLA